MADTVITIRQLNKLYANGFQALENVNLEICKGEIFGLLGPNGAGKTTLINIIAGLTLKTSGDVRVFGRDVESEYRFTRRHIGVVQQEINNDPFFTVRETVTLQAGYYGLRRIDARVEDILRTVNLWDKRDEIGRRLSGGTKRRVMIAKALVHDPEIIFLDEPTAGVDVELRANLWEVIRDMRSRRKTIILTTHYLEEAEALSDRIGIIDHGRILLTENTRELMRNHGKKLEQIYLQVINSAKTNA